jgi:iron complex outermembrane receptor protein
MRSMYLVATVGCGLVAWPHAVIAAQGASGQGAPVPGSVTTKPDAAPAANEDIIVTATRRSERLQDVPVAVTALSGGDIERGGIASSRELAQAVPSLYIANSVTIYQPTIRGIGSKGTSPGDESSVSTYIDGVYQPVTFAGQFDLLQVDRVEVLRGPQGTLFGRNATGGLINIITATPTFDPQLRLRASVASFHEQTVGGYVSAGLDERFALDFAGQYSRDSGYVQDLVRGGKIGGRKSIAMRSKALIELGGDARLILSANHFNTRDASVAAYAPVNGNTQGFAASPAGTIPTAPYQAGLSIIPATHVRQTGVSGQLKVPIGSLNLETTTAYQRNHLYSLTDSDASPAALTNVEATNNGKAFSNEIRLLSNANDKFRWIAGMFYFRASEGYNPLLVGTTSSQVSGGRTRSASGFAEGTLRFASDWHLIAGIRYTQEHREFYAARNGVTLFPTAKTDFDRWTPRVSLQYEPTRSLNIYATFSQGFKSGVFNTASTNPLPVRPEKLTSYEGGVKWDPTSWLRMNGAAFHYDYKDMQFSARDTAGLTRLLNVGKATVDGGELEISAVPIEGVSLRASAAYADARYRDFANAPNTVPKAGGGNVANIINATGNQMIKFPKFTINLAANVEHRFDIGRATASVNYYHASTIFFDANNRLKQPAFSLLNAELGLWLPGDQLRVAIFGRNLTDTAVYNTIVTSTLADYGTFAKPRVLGASLEIRL